MTNKIDLILDKITEDEIDTYLLTCTNPNVLCKEFKKNSIVQELSTYPRIDLKQKFNNLVYKKTKYIYLIIFALYLLKDSEFFDRLDQYEIDWATGIKNVYCKENY